MPIASSDIHFKLSVTTGSAGNSTAQGNVNNSLGKYISTTDITDNTLDNLFNDETGDENAAQQVDYRCIFIHNHHASITWQSVVVWLSGVRATCDASTGTFSATAHPFVNGDEVRMDAEYNTDAIPGAFANSTTYYVVNALTNTFQLSLTVGGAAVASTSIGSVAVRKYGTTTITIALDNDAASAIGATPAQADVIASSTTAPTGAGAFSAPTTKAAGLALGNLTSDQCRAIWVKRAALNSAARNNDGCVIRAEGDTTA